LQALASYLASKMHSKSVSASPSEKNAQTNIYTNPITCSFQLGGWKRVHTNSDLDSDSFEPEMRSVALICAEKYTLFNFSQFSIKFDNFLRKVLKLHSRIELDHIRHVSNFDVSTFLRTADIVGENFTQLSDDSPGLWRWKLNPS
jgi:hypothetical protein